MNDLEKNISIREALRKEFDYANKDRAIELYYTSKALGYESQAYEMANDVYVEFNIDLKW